MKKILTLFALMCYISSLTAQPAPTLSEPISVTANSSTWGKHLPRVLSLADSTIVVFWSKSGSNAGLYLARLEGESFGEVIQVPTGDLQPNIWNGGLGPGIAAYGTAIYITFEIWGQGVYCVRSADGGQTFEEPVLAIDPPAGRTVTLPAIGIDASGNPMIGGINSTLSEQDPWYEFVRSEDGGVTFSEPVIASAATEGQEVCECCPSSLLATDEGDIYISIRNNNSNTRDIWIVRSTDGGLTFEDAVDADPTDWFIQGCPSTGPHTIHAGDDLVTVFYSNGEGWEPGVYLSTVDMTTFEAGSTMKLPFIDGSPGVQNFPRISGSGDTLGMVWHENINPFFNIGFAWTVSGPGGIVEQAINTGGGESPQTYPDIHFAYGKFHIVYEDQASSTVYYQTADFQPATGIFQNISQNVAIALHPNPAHESLSVSVPVTAGPLFHVEVFDLTGRRVIHQAHDRSPIELDIRGLEKGFYTVHVSAGNQSFTGKLLVGY